MGRKFRVMKLGLCVDGERGEKKCWSVLGWISR